MQRPTWSLTVLCSAFAFTLGYIAQDLLRKAKSQESETTIEVPNATQSEKRGTGVIGLNQQPEVGGTPAIALKENKSKGPIDPKKSFEDWLAKYFGPINVRVKPFGSLYFKTALRVEDVRYDIQKTDSLVSPYIGIVNCRVVALEGQTTYKTPKEAEADQNLDIGVKRSIRVHVAHQEGKWVPKTLEYEDEKSFRAFEPGGTGPRECQYLWRLLQE